ncbi:MAG: single-stranded-DNA-specific exonuclease RecJ [Lachnospiraceae bacterium]|nr:single-stranded-DNA-specific exonuclease RecJ [Lachnospiraceae bacterium]
MEKWVVAAKRADFNQIAHDFSIDPVMARLIRNRDVIGNEQIQRYLYGNKEQLHSPWRMKDMEKAVNILCEKISNHARIRVIGDYDIDGVMSTYILETGLRRVGADVDFMIPNRITDGYGLNEHLILQAKEEGRDTIVTCDNGISAFEQIERAKSLGMTVIVTDHHELLDEKIPAADAVINPKRQDCTYPFTGLCGAAVAWKLIVALYEKCGIPKEEAEDFLEYAAFATVGDVMDLVEENRIIVKEGLKQLHHTKNTGLRELMRVNDLEPECLNAYHIGFVLGPCMNASGRLDTAKRALELLRSENVEDAARLAGDLKSLNESRKALTLQGVELAVEQVEKTSIKEDKVYVIYLPECHESLAGIIAGRIRERYYHPVFVLTKGEEGIKGSGRSIESYHMFDAMAECREVFTHFGGHKMAAGLSLPEENVELLRRRINETCALTEEDFVPKITIDVPMPFSYVTKELIVQMELLEPFGKGNTKPIFAQKDIKVLNHRIIGKNRNVLSLKLDDGMGRTIDGICFQNAEELEQRIVSGKSVSVTYYPTLNTYQGRESIQIVISHFQ